MNDDAAGQGPHERPVGRPVDEATDTSGPRGTYGCACLDRDSVQCAAIRYGMDHYGEACGRRCRNARCALRAARSASSRDAC